MTIKANSFLSLSSLLEEKIQRQQQQDEGSLLPPLRPRGLLHGRAQEQERADLLHLHRHHHRPRQLHHQRHHRGPDRAVLQGAVPHPGQPPGRLPGGAVQRLDGEPAPRHHRRPRQRQPQPPAGLQLHRDVPLNIFCGMQNVS